MIRRYESGFYRGQQVISVWDGEPDYYAGRAKKGAIGIYMNYDTWQQAHQIRWPGSAFNKEPWENYDRWVISSVRDYPVMFEAYTPEPARVEEGRVCNNCACVVTDENTEMTYIPEVGWVCADCLKREYEFCEFCKTYHRRSEMALVDVFDGYDLDANPRYHKGWFCEDYLTSSGDYFKCGVCGQWHNRCTNEYSSTGYGYYVCEECKKKEEWEECPDCGRWYLKVDMKDVIGADHRMCERCAIQFKRRNIHNYGYKPTPKFKVEGSHDQVETDRSIKELLFGVELEIDKGEDDGACATEIVTVCDDVYCKHDGSLECGVEIVSHPCTLNYHLNDLGWDKIIEVARKYNFTSHEAKTCGLHVHVGRRQLGKNDKQRDDTAGKVVLAMSRHWDNMVKFSRRLSSQLNWAEKNNVELSDVYDDDALISAALETEEDGRYQAVNLCNSNTIEFRIFRGTLELNTIKATLEMVSNFCMYCKEHTALEVMNSQWADIAYYKDYPELDAYLEQRNLAQTQIGLFGDLPSYEYPEKPKSSWEPWIPVTENHFSDYNNEDFEIGDYVRCVNNSGGGGDEAGAPVGHVGRVVTVQGDSMRPGIDFGHEDPGLHTLAGLLDTFSGFFISGCNLVPVSPDEVEVEIPLPNPA